MSVDLKRNLGEQAAVLPGHPGRSTDETSPSDEQQRAAGPSAQAVTETRPAVPPKQEGPRQPPPGKDEILIVSPG